MNRIDRYLIWLGGSAATAVAVAWIAYSLQQEGIAPALLLPLGVGAALGAASVAIRRLAGVPAPRVAVVAAVVWGLLAVVGQDYIGHGRRLRALEEEMDAQGPIGVLASSQVDGLRPGFAAHLATVVRREPVWWSLDLALTVVAAAAVTAWGTRRDPPTLPNGE